MAKNKDESSISPEEAALEQRVDAMMDPKRPDTKLAPAAPLPDKPAAPAAPPLDIFKDRPQPSINDVKTAPSVPAKLLKDIKEKPSGTVPAKSAAPSVAAKPVKTETTAPPQEPAGSSAADAPKPAASAPTGPYQPVKIQISPSPEVSVKDDKPETPVASTDSIPPESQPETADTEPEAPLITTELSDTATDKAVDDIMATESDALLDAEDAASHRVANVAKPTGHGSWKDRLKTVLKSKWTWIAIAVIIIALFAVPATRYKLLGLVIKKPVSLTIVDSKTATPVSNAVVTLGSATAKTDAEGQVKLKAPVGKDQLTVSKQYYQTYHSSRFVGFKAPAAVKISLTATGRQVPVTVINKITGQPLSGAEIKVLNTTARTDKQGKATIVLPASSSEDNATISLSGYNGLTGGVTVTNTAVPTNTFALTPAGHVYFLSNLSGTIDVVSTNLDGTNRQTVLAGTGKEDPNTTSLLASRDWKYLVLEADRDGTRPALYLINTSNDKVTEFENSNATITPIGWYGHDFMYDVLSNTTPQSQTGQEMIKSYDADNQQPNQLDESQAQGDSSSYAYQQFSNFYILSNELIYTTQWYTGGTGGSAPDLSGKTDTIRIIQPNGQNKKDEESLPATTTGYMQAALYAPQGVYFSVYDNSSQQTTYYNFDNQLISADSNLNQSDFSNSYPTYLLSPSGSQTFWTDLRDGQNALFTGSDNAGGAKQILSSGSYSPYGWYTNNYVLLSKNSSQLFIMPASGLKAGQQPLKISDYYKPPQTFPGYGYGYGGL